MCLPFTNKSEGSLAGRGLISTQPKLADFRFWHIASFRCAAEFGCYRGITVIG